jgi:tricarballylate dehydrogenase
VTRDGCKLVVIGHGAAGLAAALAAAESARDRRFPLEITVMEKSAEPVLYADGRDRSHRP